MRVRLLRVVVARVVVAKLLAAGAAVAADAGRFEVATQHTAHGPSRRSPLAHSLFASLARDCNKCCGVLCETPADATLSHTHTHTR